MKKDTAMNRYAVVVACLCMSTGSANAGGPVAGLAPVFESAGGEFSVPPTLLKAIAFVETRWAQVEPVPDHEAHMPPAYGVMGLRDDDWFGHSLPTAASLIGLDVSVLREDPASNIRGAAAYIGSLRDATTPKPEFGDLATWIPVIAAYSGIPQQDLRGSYIMSVFTILRDGYHEFGIDIAPQDIPFEQIARKVSEAYPPQAAPFSDDYGPAVWDPSPNFNSRGGVPITNVVIHDTEGGFDGSVSWLKNPASQASAHYIFRSADGYLKQLVRETDRAWHVRCWNSWTIGIEHEGYVSNPAYFTQVMYQQSAFLVRHLTERYGIARDRLHIVGHNVWTEPVLFPMLGWEDCNDHTDPGPFWNWNYFLSLVVADSTRPLVTGTYPAPDQQDIRIDRNISLTFDRPMNVIAVRNGFRVTPATQGTFNWSNDGRTMTFDPSGFLLPSTTYTVNLADTVRSSGGGLIQAGVQVSFTTAAPDSVGPAVVSSFPVDGASAFGAAMGFRIIFDESVQFSSFAGRVKLVDVADSAVQRAVSGVVYTDVGDQGVLAFGPTQPLAYGHTYRLAFLPGLRDVFGNLSTGEHRITFTVETSGPPQGIVCDSLEDNSGQWQQPVSVAGTAGVDSAGTNFSISITRKKRGYYSGNLNYAFSTASGGVVRLMRSQPIPVPHGWFGAWVYGDDSRHQLEYWFDGTSGDQIVVVDTVDWAGWKFVYLPVDGLPVTGFNSVVIRQQSGGTQAGSLFIDDLQTEFPTGVAESGAPHVSFALYQNYPNPFNPTTRIFFDLERDEHVTLSVYTILGQNVATLIDGPLTAGRHVVEFGGRDERNVSLPSGVYVYRLNTRAGVQMKKMMLIR